ncbi:RNA polymerase sigma-70 factor [Xanthocytophaga agilis]|uniref:RNA polymerase sigma-70 factor n=1 Tax=Xanthocytophaga agilis TaxID=3048010 RepID=A0AAE3R5V0_9BACT|nr:RNA polymerase sigma-70 factor [Xanthocytophaga agilis]MDJ1501368.1 RNA polymerase sigma-70 factor [Xanthocytophaga agilis]
MKKVNSDAVETLFKQYHKELCRWAYTFVRDKEQAQDIVQEVFLKLWNNREELEWGEQLRSYLYKSTTHVSLNHLERLQKKHTIHQHIQQSNNFVSNDTTDSVLFNELHEKVQQAIANLPPKCKVIYLLSRQEGLKYQQIAEQLDLSVKTVENQMGIALEKLRISLKPYLSKEFLISLLLLIVSWITEKV